MTSITLALEASGARIFRSLPWLLIVWLVLLDFMAAVSVGSAPLCLIPTSACPVTSFCI